MSIIPGGTPSTLASLLQLVQSPRVRYTGNQLRRALPSIGGPLMGSRPGIAPSNSRMGASPVVGQWYENKGDTFGSAIGESVAGLLGGQQQQQDPLMSLYEQLLSQLQQPVNMPTGVNTEDLMNQVRKALDPIYDQRASAAQSQSARGRKEVENMYRALANDYERLAPEQLAQSNAAKAEIEKLYGQLRSNIEGSYSRVSNEQSELFRQLGIEDALPDVLGDQQAAITDATTAASENQAQQQQRYMDIGQADATYYREGAPNATMTGNEIQTDMLAQLQEQLDRIEAERSSGIQTGYMDQLGQANNSLMQQQQMANSEAARRQEMLWQILLSQMQGKQSSAVLTPDSYMAQLSPELQQSVGGAFSRLQRSPEAVYGKVEDKRNPVPGTYVETTPQWYLAQADEMLRRGEIDPSTHQQLLMYIQLYFGMGK